MNSHVLSSELIALLAGSLTVLSPCVLPILPFVTGSSLSKSKFGPLALALGLLVTFTGATLLISRAGSFFGVSSDNLRIISGILLASSGLLFIFEKLQEALSEKLSRLTGRFAQNQSALDASLTSQFLSGIFLGFVWTPCSGPSLGAALGLATEASSFSSALTILLFFGAGAAVPLLLIAYGSRALFLRLRGQTSLMVGVKKILGVFIVLVGFSIASGLDRKLETFVTSLLPDSWLEFVTKY